MICVYKHFDARGELIYIGSTIDFYSRTSIHKHSPWSQRISRIEIERFDKLVDARDREQELIRSLTPRFNITYIPIRKYLARPMQDGEEKILAQVRAYLESASIAQLIEFIHLAGITIFLAREIIENRQCISIKTLARIKTAISYLLQESQVPQQDMKSTKKTTKATK